MEAASQVFLKSGLPNQILSQIWRLCLVSSTNSLTFPEFCLNMFLIKAKLGGQPIPNSLPENVKMAVLNSISSIQRHLSAQSNFTAIGPSTNSSMIPERNLEISRTQDKSATDRSHFTASANQYSTESSSAADRSGWAVNAVDKAKYDSIFKAWDTANTGYITVSLIEFNSRLNKLD